MSAPAPLAPAPALAGLPTLIERLPLGFDWPGQAPAWRAQVFESDGAERLVLDGRFERPVARWADLPDGSYRLRVRAQDRQGLEGQDAEHRFRVKARPEPPLLRQPDLGQRVVGPEASFLWAPSQAAARYRLQVAPSADFNSPLHDRKGLDEARLTLPMPPGRWVWRMASITADGDQGPWSDPYEFEQFEIPPAPSAEPPQTETGGVVLRWKAPREGSRTQFQLARDREFTQLVEDQTLDASHIRFANPPPGRYAIRLRTIDAVGTIGPWAATSELNIEAPPPPPTPWWWWLAPVLLWLWVI